MIEIIPNWHPILVHFTIALTLTSIGLYLLATAFRQHKWHGQWLNVANWNLWLASFFAVATALAGWYAYNTVAHDTPSHEAMTEHRNWALITLAAILIMAAWSIVRYRANKSPNAPFLGVAIVVGALVVTTGWHGAEAVYRYGLGVMSLPQAEGDGHDHEHADDAGHDEMEPDMHDDGESDDHHDEQAGDDHHDESVTDGHHDEPVPDDHHDEPAADDHHGDEASQTGSDDSDSEGGVVHTHEDGTVERH